MLALAVFVYAALLGGAAAARERQTLSIGQRTLHIPLHLPVDKAVGGNGTVHRWPGDHQASTRQLIIVDTDYGNYLDDPFALAAISRNVGDSLALVLSQGPEEAAMLAAQLLITGSHPDGSGHMPAVAVGARHHDNHPPVMAAYLDPLLLPRVKSIVQERGIKVAEEVVRTASAGRTCGSGPPPVLWFCIGAATNLAAFLRRAPDLTCFVKLVMMAGSARPGIHLPWGEDCCNTPIAECNLVTDLPASQAVLAASWGERITYAPIDSTFNSSLHGLDYQSLWEAAFPSAPSCRAQLETLFALAGTDEYLRRFGRSYRISQITGCGGEIDAARGDPMARTLLETYLAWIGEVLLAGPSWAGWGEAHGIASSRMWRHRTPPLFDLFAYMQHAASAHFDIREELLTIQEDGRTVIGHTGGGTPIRWGWECPDPEGVWEELRQVSFLTGNGAPPLERTGVE